MKRLKRICYVLIVSLSLVLVSPEGISGIPTNVASQVQAKSTTVYVTKTGKKYHKKKCGNGTYTKTTLAKAKARGLTKCKKCY